MAIPNSNVTILDGRLGLTPEIATNVIAVVGCSSLGSTNQIEAFAGGNPQAIVNTFGQGPMPEAAAYANQRGVPVICCKVAQSAAGAAGSVTNSGTGTAVLSAASSVPRDSYSVKVAIVTPAGDPNDGIATFRYSLDGGLSYSPEIALPTSGSYTIPNSGVTIDFGTTGTLVSGDVYSFACTSPVYTTTELNAALTALLADAREWFLLSIIGVPADSSAMLGIFAAVASKLSTAAAAFRFARGIMSAYSGNDAALIASALSLSDLRFGVGAGFGTLLSPLTGSQMSRPVGHWVTAAKLGAIDPQIDAAQFDLGAEPGVVALARNEEATPGLDAARYSTLRTFTGVPGFYITNGRIMSGPTSDFRYYQHGRVMDIAAKVVRVAGLKFVNKSIRVSKTTGRILEEEARNIENEVQAKLRAETTEKGRASDATAKVDRTTNILTTSEMFIDYDIVPLGYAKQVTGRLGFKNPALTQVTT